MTEATKAAIVDIRGKLAAKYEGWSGLAPAERRLLCMAYLVDVIKVREVGGNNLGYWVEIFQNAAGVGAGAPWCAAMLTFASMVAEAPYPLRSEGYNPAAVVSWRKWAKDKGYLVEKPGRGAIVMHKTTATTGHIGVCVLRSGERVNSLEGNTSPSVGGSQRDGGGAYRRARDLDYWSWGFAL